ncbi:MAG: C1 family peptidase [Pseudomonadota bacterium]
MKLIFKKNYFYIFLICISLFLLNISPIFSLVAFEDNDSLSEIRKKIQENGYNFEVDHTWVYDLPQSERDKVVRLGVPITQKTSCKTSKRFKFQVGDELLPASFDWRDYNGHSYVNAIRNQGSCGSCYAFADVAAAEGTYNFAMGLYDDDRASFSESFMLYCLADLEEYSSHMLGCGGADVLYYDMDSFVEYGAIALASFAYTETDPGCTHWGNDRTQMTSYERIDCNDIAAIKSAIKNYGSVRANVLTTSAFTAYVSGIYEDENTACAAEPCYLENVDHAIALVGWNDNGDADNNGYWILRNSWGDSWGEAGYMRIKYTSAAVSCAAAYYTYTSTLTSDPISIVFEDVYVNDASDAFTIILTNSGAPDVSISSAALTGTDADDFSLSEDNCTGVTLSSGESCSLKIIFTPSSAKVMTAYLSVLYNDADIKEITINAEGLNNLPTASAGPDQTVDESESVSLNGANSSDADGTIVSYLWSQSSGTTVTLSSVAAASPTFDSPNVGENGEALVFNLTVTDNDGGQDVDSCIVNVTWINVAPVADAGDNQTVEEGDIVTLDGSASSDEDDGIAIYLWEQTAGTSVTLSDSSSSEPTFTAPDTGVDGEALTFQLTVTDESGLQDTDTVVVNVSWVNATPIALTGSDQTVKEGVTVILDASLSSDIDDGIASYEWTQSEGDPVTLSDSTSATPTFVAPIVASADLTLIFTVTVTDVGGLQDTYDTAITVQDNAITDFASDILSTYSFNDIAFGFKIISGGDFVAIDSYDPDTLSLSATPTDMGYGIFEIKIKTEELAQKVKFIIYLSIDGEENSVFYNYKNDSSWSYENSTYSLRKDLITVSVKEGGGNDYDGEEDQILTFIAGINEPSSISSEGQSTSSDWCFIATAAYGSKLDPHVVYLRQFRDQYLMKNLLGRKFVEFYYEKSPAIAKIIADNAVYRFIVKILLLPFVLFSFIILNYPILSILLSLSMLPAFWLIIFVKRIRD